MKSLIPLIFLTLLFFKSSGQNVDIKDIENRLTENHKSWTLKFKRKADFGTITDSVGAQQKTTLIFDNLSKTLNIKENNHLIYESDNPFWKITKNGNDFLLQVSASKINNDDKTNYFEVRFVAENNKRYLRLRPKPTTFNTRKDILQTDLYFE